MRRNLIGGRMSVIRVLPWILVAPLFLVPLGMALWAAVASADGRTGAGLLTLALSPAVLASLRFSLVQAALSTLLALLFGMPGAWLLARYRFLGRRWYAALSGIPFVFPPVLFTLGFTRVWGLNGLVNQLLMTVFGLANPPITIAYSLWGVVLAHAMFNFPLVVGLVSAVWKRSSGNLEQAARCLWAREGRIFWSVTLPSIMPGLLAAVVLVFLYCFMSFAIPLVLGGGPEFATLEVSIFVAANGDQDFARAGIIAGLEALVSVSVLLAWMALTRRSALASAGSDTEDSAERLAVRTLRPLGRWLARAWLAVSSLAALSPALALLLTSLGTQRHTVGGNGFSLGQYQVLFSQPEYLRAVLDSAILAVAVGLVAVLIGLVLLAGEEQGGVGGRGALFRAAFFALPIALSSVMLSLGYLVLFPLGSSVWVLILVQATAAYPLAYRALAAARERIGRDLAEAAWVLGASRWQYVRQLEFPLLRPALLSAFALCAALSLGEINAALMLNVANFPLLGLKAYRLMAAYQYPLACALGVLVCVVAGLAFAVSQGKEANHGLA